MDKVKAQQISNDVRAAIAGVLKDHGLVLERTSGSYDPTMGSYQMRINFQEEASREKAVAARASMVADALGARVAVGDMVKVGMQVLGKLVDFSTGGCPIIEKNGKKYRYKVALVSRLEKV